MWCGSNCVPSPITKRVENLCELLTMECCGGAGGAGMRAWSVLFTRALGGVCCRPRCVARGDWCVSRELPLRVPLVYLFLTEQHNPPTLLFLFSFCFVTFTYSSLSFSLLCFSFFHFCFSSFGFA